MNSMRNDQEHLLDLLVDGELTESQRRELLLWCERDPEGWRRCALAFLEAQSWSRELAGLDPDSLLAIGRPDSATHNPPHDESESNMRPAPEADAERQVAGRGAPRWRVVGWPLAMAASFLVSFALGLWTRGGWMNSSSGEPEPAPANMIAKQELIDRLRQDALSQKALGRDAAPAPVASIPARGPSGQVRLVVDGPNGMSDEIELPVVEGFAADADFLQSPPAALPLEVQRALERMGARVQQQRELVPLRMQDGRRLIVPVDKVEVHPVGNRAYQ